jgi:hypothetical protein
MSPVTSPHSEQEAQLAELAAALAEIDSVPPHLLALAEATFTWRTIDAELALAELVFDSACDPAPAGPTRSGGPNRSGGSVRTLAFHGPDVTLEIEVSQAGIVGQVIPASGGHVTGMATDAGFDEAPIDETGCFVLRAPPPGPVRLRVDTGARVVGTSWVRLSRASR